MSTAARAASRLSDLRQLGDRPGEQASYAAQLLTTERNTDLQLAALRILTDRPDPAWRPALLQCYGQLQANAARRDQGGTVRAAILRALTPVARLEDTPLLEQAATTYEFLFGEAAGPLRAAALLALDEVEPRLAGFHAVRLLTDQHTSIMSGEPAVTAAKVLAARGQALPLYAYVVQSDPPLGDVAAECLRGLSSLPASLLPGLIARYRESTDELLLLGVFDLLLAHEARVIYHPFMLEFLSETRLFTLYRSLIATLVVTRDEDLIAALTSMAETETDPRKLDVLREALALATPGQPRSRRRGPQRDDA
jgi:hypothetical protein